MHKPTLTESRAELAQARGWFRLFAAGAVLCQLSMLVLRGTLYDQLIVGGICAGAVALVAAIIVTAGARSVVGRLAPVIVSFGWLAVAGVVTSGLGPALGGSFTIAFVYVGLSMRPGTASAFVPVAAGSWLLLNRPIDSVVLARLSVAVGVWLLVGEMLSRVTADRAAGRVLLARLAMEDALTGLLNRHGLDDRLAALEPGDAVVFVDLDHFKKVNDTFGHGTGDRVLADLGRVILAVLRPKDVGVRYGGEEILLVLPGTPAAGVDRCLDRLRMGWTAAHPEMTFSAGAAIVDETGGSAAVGRADEALYRAKADGRNCTVHADEPAHPVVPPQARSREFAAS
jgi:diguanylate cyclase (GGDEF)-like protein